MSKMKKLRERLVGMLAVTLSEGATMRELEEALEPSPVPMVRKAVKLELGINGFVLRRRELRQLGEKSRSLQWVHYFDSGAARVRHNRRHVLNQQVKAGRQGLVWGARKIWRRGGFVFVKMNHKEWTHPKLRERDPSVFYGKCKVAYDGTDCLLMHRGEVYVMQQIDVPPA